MNKPPDTMVLAAVPPEETFSWPPLLMMAPLAVALASMISLPPLPTLVLMAAPKSYWVPLSMPPIAVPVASTNCRPPMLMVVLTALP